MAEKKTKDDSLDAALEGGVNASDKPSKKKDSSGLKTMASGCFKGGKFVRSGK